MCPEFINFIEESVNMLSVHVNKFEWMLNFCNYKSNDFLG
jgi:hypothetical protein